MNTVAQKWLRQRSNTAKKWGESEQQFENFLNLEKCKRKKREELESQNFA